MTSTAEYAAQKNDCYKKEDKINQRFDQSHIPIAPRQDKVQTTDKIRS